MRNKSKIIKVALADDHVIVREGLAKLINDFGDCNVIFQASDGLEVIESLNLQLIPDVLILDLNMPNMDGIETANWLRVNHPGIRILVVTMYDSEHLLTRMVKAGVRGFFKKDIPNEELHFAIMSVIRTGFYFNNNFTEKLVNRTFNGEEISELEGNEFTDQEVEFMKLACSDLTYKEVCLKMGLSPRSADKFRIQLFRKINVQSRVGLVMYAIQKGWVMIKH